MTHSVVRSRFTRRKSRLRSVAALAALTLVFTGVGAVAAQASPESSGMASARPGKHTPRPTAPLTNLSHLNFLLDTVPLSAVQGHTTFNIDEDPTALAPWTYADRNDDGSFTRIGGGDLDSATGHWSQGAYNADDIARTAVVYLRHWQQTGDAASRENAFQTLRSLTYLQTAEGPNAGNVVLWQQANGTLTPSATPQTAQRLTALNATDGSTPTPAPSRPFTPCCRCSPWTRTPGSKRRHSASTAPWPRMASASSRPKSAPFRAPEA